MSENEEIQEEVKEEKPKKKKKRVDKSRLAIKIVAAILALAFIVPTIASIVFYVI